MSTPLLSIDEFLRAPGCLVDVTSPHEFAQGHIPGAINIPTLDDAEQEQISTLYSTPLGEKTALLALKLIAPKLAQLSSAQQNLTKQDPRKTLRVYCAKGGKRGPTMVGIFKRLGFNCVLLEEGYRGFRKWAQAQLQQEMPLVMLGGLTGAGKTRVLNALKKKGAHTINFEKLANHRGSVLDDIAQPLQPTQEQFENLLAWEIGSHKQHCGKIPLWFEDGNRSIGRCNIPPSLLQRMQNAPLFLMEVTDVERLQNIKTDYPVASLSELIEATSRLQKKLGTEKATKITTLLKEHQLDQAIFFLLSYYDKVYLQNIEKRSQKPITINGKHWSPDKWADELLKACSELTLSQKPSPCSV